MGQKLPPKQLALYEALDVFLYEEWDPIGVAGSTGARDEYYSYLPQVFKRALEDASAQEIAAYLHWVVSDSMGMDCTVQSQLPFAEKIKEITRKILA